MSDPALLIIDLQNAIDDPSWGHDRNNPDAETNVAKLLSFWRERSWPVFHVRHLSLDPKSTYRPGEPGVDFKREAVPRHGERVIDKHTNSAFIDTSLERELKEDGITDVVITGVITNNSVEATARMAGNLGFTTYVIADATATFGRRDFDGQWRTAAEVHAMSLANLDGEYATVIQTSALLAEFAPRRRATFSEVTSRRGDAIAIPGDYQLRASRSSNAVQRFWHAAKKIVIDDKLPPARGDVILDAGCGSGVIADYLAQSGATVTAIDANAEAIRFATSAFQRPNLRFVSGFVDENMHLDRPVDKIYSLEVIEHMHEPQGLAMLQNFFRLLRPGGRVLLTTPNYRSLWPLLEWTLDLFGLVPVLDEEQHVAHYHQRSLRQIGQRAGFKVETVQSVCFLSPWIAPVSWKLATATAKRELKLPIATGCILVAAMEKPA